MGWDGMWFDDMKSAIYNGEHGWLMVDVSMYFVLEDFLLWMFLGKAKKITMQLRRYRL